MYIHQHTDWTDFRWDNDELLPLMGRVRYLQGRLLGQMEHLGFPLQAEAVLTTLTLDVLKSSEIEGELLNPEQVRSSIARRLGLEVAGLVHSPRHVDGVVEMMLDATQRYDMPLTSERLFGWHNALFPTGFSGLYKIEVAKYRSGEMQVVSGAMGKERVHYEAPEASRVEAEMTAFLSWFNATSNIDPVIKAAIAHSVCDHTPVRRWERPYCAGDYRHAALSRGRDFAAVLQHVESDLGRTQTILRDIGEDPARRQRHHRMDRMVSVLPRTCADRQYRSLKIGIGESRILGNP